jgi:hypothetical protein
MINVDTLNDNDDPSSLWIPLIINQTLELTDKTSHTLMDNQKPEESDANWHTNSLVPSPTWCHPKSTLAS